MSVIGEKLEEATVKYLMITYEYIQLPIICFLVRLDLNGYGIYKEKATTNEGASTTPPVSCRIMFKASYSLGMV